MAEHSEWHASMERMERERGTLAPWTLRVDEHGNEHWHEVPRTGQFRLMSSCDGCDALEGT